MKLNFYLAIKEQKAYIRDNNDAISFNLTATMFVSNLNWTTIVVLFFCINKKENYEKL